jgi:type I restriction enzyme, S subunit
VNTVEFGALFQFIRNGMNIKQDKTGDGLPITRIETISNSVVDEARVGYAGLSENDCRDWLLEPGDILFSHINSVEHVGKCAVYRGTPETLVHGMNLLCLRSDRSKLLPEFGKYLIRGTAFRARLSSFINKAVNQASVSIGNLKRIQVFLPSLADQRRIVEVLDHAEALRTKRRAALTQLDALTQSIFLDLFGDPACNPKGWPRKRISEIGTVITGNTPRRTNAGYYGTHIEWIKSDNINTPYYYVTKANECLSESGKAVGRTVPAGSILVTCIAGSPECIGNAAMTDREVAFNQQINAFVPITGDAHFFYAQILVGKRLIQEASTAGMKGMVSKARFEQILLIFPPVELQHEFARHVAAVEKLKASQTASLVEMDALFASLQHRAFNGQL